MQVKNVSRSITLVKDLKLATSFFTRLRGLLGRREFLLGEGLLIEPCNWVHTLGMRFPIDVLFLDKEHLVVAIERLKPNQFGTPQRCHCVLELPWGTIGASGTEIGDRLKLDF